MQLGRRRKATATSDVIRVQALRQSRLVRVSLVVALALVLGGVAFAWFLGRPVGSLADAWGLYEPEAGREEQVFQWSSSRVAIPLHGRSQSTLVDLELAAEPWPNRRATVVTLAADKQPLGTFTVAAPQRQYHLLVPGSAAKLRLHSSLDQPPTDENRWVGVQVFALAATPLGLPMRAVAVALLIALLSVPLLLLAWWLVRRGYGVVGLITLLALGLRVLWLRDNPPGVHHDELISLVDSWYLLHTGRDHLGHLLPLGAFEAFGDWISPLLTYLELPFVAAFGGADPLAGRVLTVFVGTLAVPLIHGFARTLGLPQPAALVAALVVAVSPWQVSLSRTAIPPALVFVAITLLLWAGVSLIRHGDRRSAWVLALGAGVGLYAYPTLKMLVPLLAGLAVGLALLHHGWRRWWVWLLPGLALALLWLPFVAVTLSNTASSARFADLAIQADGPLAWLGDWLWNYSLYWRPGFYYLFGDRLTDHGYLKQGVQLWVEAPLVLMGLVALVRAAFVALRRKEQRSEACTLVFLVAALLLAPLPTSLTWQNPHAYRASAIAPMYTLLVGFGVAALWRWSAVIRRAQWQRWSRIGGLAVVVVGLLGQGGTWYIDYMRFYPPVAARPWYYGDGFLETMQAVSEYADEYDEIWIDTAAVNRPYIYLLAGLPTPIADPQQAIDVARFPDRYNEVQAIGPYRFMAVSRIPYQGVLAREAILTRLGERAFMATEWQQDNKRVLVVRLY